jgi:hypothetical protein
MTCQSEDIPIATVIDFTYPNNDVDASYLISPDSLLVCGLMHEDVALLTKLKKCYYLELFSYSSVRRVSVVTLYVAGRGR